jgi:hypothetical protein
MCMCRNRGQSGQATLTASGVSICIFFFTSRARILVLVRQVKFSTFVDCHFLFRLRPLVVLIAVGIALATHLYVSIRQHTSAYVSIRQHTSSYSGGYSTRHAPIRQHTSAYVSIRQHTSAYVSIRQHSTRHAPRARRSSSPGKTSHGAQGSAREGPRSGTRVSSFAFVLVKQVNWGVTW